MDARWFQNGWNIYNRGEYLQLYKDTWYNHDQGGSILKPTSNPRKTTKGVSHLFMQSRIVCTISVIKELLAPEGHRIQGWKGYKIIGKGYSICERILPLNSKNSEQRYLRTL